jgi:O-antigen ligase
MRSIFLLDPEARHFNLKEKVLYFLLSAFFISLFLPNMPVVGNVAIGAIVLHSLFYSNLTEKRRKLRDRKAVWMMLLYFALTLVGAFLSVNRSEGVRIMVLRLPLLFFPLSIGVLFIRKELMLRVWLMFCVIVTAAAGICLAAAIARWRASGDAGELYDDSLSFAVRRQSIYMALLVTLCVFGYIRLLVAGMFGKRDRWWVWTVILFLLIFHFMLASRANIIFLYTTALAVILGWLMIARRNYLQGGLLIGALCGAALILVWGFPKTLNRFRELNYTDYRYDNHASESHYNSELKPEQWNGANIRLAVWNCAWTLAGRHWIFGVPLGDKQEALNEVYRERQFDFAVKSQRNTHDTYLDVLTDSGVVGLLIFLLGWVLIPLVSSYQAKDWLGVLIVLAFASAMITETYLQRSIGALMLGFFISLLCAAKE